MGRFDRLGEVYDLAEELVVHVPDRCKPCDMAELKLQTVAHRIVYGEVSLEDTAAAVEDEFNSCTYGAAEGFDGTPECRDNILCELPPRPSFDATKALDQPY